jgi:hypothetical protein
MSCVTLRCSMTGLPLLRCRLSGAAQTSFTDVPGNAIEGEAIYAPARLISPHLARSCGGALLVSPYPTRVLSGPVRLVSSRDQRPASRAMSRPPGYLVSA